MSTLRRLWWHLNRTPAAHAFKAVQRVRHVREVAQRRRLRESFPAEGACQRKAAELESVGYTDLTDVLAPELTRSLAEASTRKVERAAALAGAQVHSHKSFWVRLLDEDAPGGQFASDNVFVRFAMQPAILGVVTARLGELPRLVDVLLTFSQPSAAELSYSQLWHRDYDDVHTLKVFVYLTDVTDPDDGPFTFIPGPASDGVGFTLHSHLPDGKLFSKVGRDAVREMRGPRLTAFACETSRCLHMGSRLAPGHARLMYTATFISAPSVYPGVMPRFRLVGSATPAERLVLGV
jgi:hypothetical protein